MIYQLHNNTYIKGASRLPFCFSDIILCMNTSKKFYSDLSLFCGNICLAECKKGGPSACSSEDYWYDELCASDYAHHFDHQWNGMQSNGRYMQRHRSRGERCPKTSPPDAFCRQVPVPAKSVTLSSKTKRRYTHISDKFWKIPLLFWLFYIPNRPLAVIQKSLSR